MTQTNTTQNKEELRIPEDLLERDAKKYLIMRSNLALLKDETGTYIRNTILNDYYMELRKSSQAHQSGIEEERKRIIKVIESFIDPNPVFLEEHREKIFLKEVIKSLKENKQ